MRTPLLDRLIGGFVWQPARINVRSPHASANELATALAHTVVPSGGLALVSLGQGDFVHNLVASRRHSRSPRSHRHRPS